MKATLFSIRRMRLLGVALTDLHPVYLWYGT